MRVAVAPPRLAPWATLFRPSGAEEAQGRDRRAYAAPLRGKNRRRSAAPELFADRAHALHASPQAALGAAHTGDGALELLDALVQLRRGAVGVQQAAGQLLDRRLDLRLEDLQERAAVGLRLDGRLVEGGQQPAVDHRVHGPLRVER